MSENVYETPKSEVVQKSAEIKSLATRWQRLGASSLDSLIVLAVVVPFIYFTDGFDGISKGEQPSFTYSLIVFGIGLLTFIVVNVNFLINNGQTIGKKAVGIKIVDLQGNLPSIKGHLIKRYLVYFIPGQIPLVGQIFPLINILFIFGKEKRCLHDFAGGTKVIKT